MFVQLESPAEQEDPVEPASTATLKISVFTTTMSALPTLIVLLDGLATVVSAHRTPPQHVKSTTTAEQDIIALAEHALLVSLAALPVVPVANTAILKMCAFITIMFVRQTAIVSADIIATMVSALYPHRAITARQPSRRLRLAPSPYALPRLQLLVLLPLLHVPLPPSHHRLRHLLHLLP
jgi:hypothetical protein